MDIFFAPEYGRLYEDIENATCEVFDFVCEHGQVKNMFLKRKVARRVDGVEHYDITTPYGYGGPVVLESKNTEQLLNAYYREFSRYCSGHNIVSEFVRFHLFDNDDVRLRYYGTVSRASPNVVRRLDTPWDSMWMEFEHKVRKNYRRAVSNQLQVEIDMSGDHLQSFLDIYYETMIRNNAKRYYYFPQSYFDTLNRTLSGHYAYFHVRLGGRIISTELVLFSDKYAYSFLGGTYRQYYHYRPNDLLKVEIIRWCRETGKSCFVLGGGYSEGDGIYRYKKAFAPGGDVPFFVGKKIHNEYVYNRLVEMRRQETDFDDHSTYFPAYRR